MSTDTERFTTGMRRSDRAALCRARSCIAVVVFGLLLSGVTAFPLETEVRWGCDLLHAAPGSWVCRVRDALVDTNAHYPFLAYGTDWLAFAHLALAVLFVGPYRDPVRNAWVIDFGLIACGGVVLLAMIAGPVRGVPFGWRCIDCSFGILAAGPLWVARRSAVVLARADRNSQ